MHVLGPIVMVQVQRSPLKVGFKPGRKYDPAPITVTDRIRLSKEGTVGLVGDEEIIDVHHRAHPLSRQGRVEQGLSIGFTRHYQEMRERFGEHVTVGCAGENVIVDVPRRITLSEVAGGLAIISPAGMERVRIPRVVVAHPCKPFSGFVHRYQMVEPAELKATLQFLDEGTRGYYCVPEVTGESVEIQAGDVLAIL